MTQKEIDELALRIWHYLSLNHPLEVSDCILVLGSHDPRVAERGAELYLDGWAPWLVLSGNAGAITRRLWDRPEAEIFGEIARGKGVPEERILLENRSTNTGENIVFTRQLLHQRRIHCDRVILVSKPYTERRAWATFMKQWPGNQVASTSPQIGYFEYPNSIISREEMINTMVGDLQRMKVYAVKGFQVEQAIPPDVWNAYEQLAAAGFSQRLI